MQYNSQNRSVAAAAFESLVLSCEKRLRSEFTTDVDVVYLAHTLFARGFLEIPGQLPTGANAKTGNSLMERLFKVQQTTGLGTSFLNALDSSGAAKAEAWLDKSVKTYDSIQHPDAPASRLPKVAFGRSPLREPQCASKWDDAPRH